MNKYKNYNQIYTHSSEHGVIIGQYWVPKESNQGLAGRVKAILENGHAIITHSPNLCGPTRIDINTLIKEWVIKLPVLVLPYLRVNRSLGIQVFAFENEYTITPYICGELKRDYALGKDLLQ